MDNFIVDSIGFLFEGTSFSVLTLSLVMLLGKNTSSTKYLGALVYFLYGLIALLSLARRSGVCEHYPHLLYVNYPVLFLLGPVIYYYHRSWIDERFTFKVLQLLFLLPTLLSLVYCMPFFLLSPGEKLELIDSVSWGPFPFLVAGVIPLEYFILGWIALCLALFSLYAYSLLGKKDFQYRKQSRILMIYSLLWVVPVMSLFYLFLFVKNAFFSNLGMLLFNCILLVVYFFSVRFSDFFNAIRKDASEVRYKNSRVKGINVESVLLRLSDLMRYEHLYRDESLNLSWLSRKLSIAPYQLSEILNRKLKTNFNAFINSYRIEEAKRLLREENRQNILTVAFQCGFSSKTTFNTVFLKRVGLKPSEYREKYIKETGTEL